MSGEFIKIMLMLFIEHYQKNRLLATFKTVANQIHNRATVY